MHSLRGAHRISFGSVLILISSEIAGRSCAIAAGSVQDLGWQCLFNIIPGAGEDLREIACNRCEERRGFRVEIFLMNESWLAVVPPCQWIRPAGIVTVSTRLSHSGLLHSGGGLLGRVGVRGKACMGLMLRWWWRLAMRLGQKQALPRQGYHV